MLLNSSPVVQFSCIQLMPPLYSITPQWPDLMGQAYVYNEKELWGQGGIIYLTYKINFTPNIRPLNAFKLPFVSANIIPVNE